jgi:uncharacterized protein YuzE
MRHREVITIKSATAPTITVDASNSAWYIRFSNAKVAKTVSEEKPGPVVAIDFDAAGNVIGIEILGVKELSFATALKIANVRAPKIDVQDIKVISSPITKLAA